MNNSIEPSWAYYTNIFLYADWSIILKTIFIRWAEHKMSIYREICDCLISYIWSVMVLMATTHTMYTKYCFLGKLYQLHVADRINRNFATTRKFEIVSSYILMIASLGKTSCDDWIRTTRFWLSKLKDSIKNWFLATNCFSGNVKLLLQYKLKSICKRV